MRLRIAVVATIIVTIACAVPDQAPQMSTEVEAEPQLTEEELAAQAAEAERRAEVERERLEAVRRAEQQQRENRIRAEDARTVTAAEYSLLQAGMSYQEAVEIIGFPGEEISRSDIAGITTVMYQWTNRDFSNMNAMFQNGALVTKAQFGLP